MKLSEILDLWKKDSQIEITKIDVKSLDTAQLHHKYLKLLMEHKVALRRLTKDYKATKSVLYQYYRGHLNNKEDLQEIGREPMALRILKSDVPTHLDNDPEIVEIRIKISVLDEKIECIQSILNQINNMQWTIKNAIEWQKMIGGGS